MAEASGDEHPVATREAGRAGKAERLRLTMPSLVGSRTALLTVAAMPRRQARTASIAAPLELLCVRISCSHNRAWQPPAHLQRLGSNQIAIAPLHPLAPIPRLRALALLRHRRSVCVAAARVAASEKPAQVQTRAPQQEACTGQGRNAGVRHSPCGQRCASITGARVARAARVVRASCRASWPPCTGSAAGHLRGPLPCNLPRSGGGC
jgi:hypothetical protein